MPQLAATVANNTVRCILMKSSCILYIQK